MVIVYHIRKQSGGGKRAGTSESRHMCGTCGVGLCAAPCFQKYHTLKYYQKVDGTDSDASESSSEK